MRCNRSLCFTLFHALVFRLELVDRFPQNYAVWLSSLGDGEASDNHADRDTPRYVTIAFNDNFVRRRRSVENFMNSALHRLRMLRAPNGSGVPRHLLTRCRWPRSARTGSR